MKSLNKKGGLSMKAIKKINLEKKNETRRNKEKKAFEICLKLWEKYPHEKPDNSVIFETLHSLRDDLLDFYILGGLNE